MKHKPQKILEEYLAIENDDIDPIALVESDRLNQEFWL